MNLSICGRHLDVTPAIREYVMNKLARVLRHFDHVIDTQVMLSVEPLRHKAEITMHLRGKDIHCEAVDENLYAAIDLIWQSGEVVTLAVPANGSDDETPPPAASAARPLILEQAA